MYEFVELVTTLFDVSRLDPDGQTMGEPTVKEPATGAFSKGRGEGDTEEGTEGETEEETKGEGDTERDGDGEEKVNEEEEGEEVTEGST